MPPVSQKQAKAAFVSAAPNTKGAVMPSKVAQEMISSFKGHKMSELPKQAKSKK